MFNTGLKRYETADINNFTSDIGIRLRRAVNKPWLKYYSDEVINVHLPEGSLYDYMTLCNEVLTARGIKKVI